MRIGEQSEYDLLDPGVYLAELIDVTDQRADGTPLMSGAAFGEPKPQWRFQFELLDYPEPDRRISAWVNKPQNLDNIAPNAKLTLLATALLGVAVGQEWELDDLLHQRCRLQVEVYTKRDGTEGNTVGKYYPAKKPAPAAPAAPPVPNGRGAPPPVPRRSPTAPTLEEAPPF